MACKGSGWYKDGYSNKDSSESNSSDKKENTPSKPSDKKETTKEEINAVMKEHAEGKMKGILAYNDEPLVSKDFNGNPPNLC